MVCESIQRCQAALGIEFHDWQRPGSGILIASGCGLAMALMDECRGLRYMIDIDVYRGRYIDWEMAGILLDAGRPSLIALAGWFTIDAPRPFTQLTWGVKSTPLLRYGNLGPLSEFITAVNQLLPESRRADICHPRFD